MLQAVVDQAPEAESQLRAVGLLLLADIYRNAGRVADARKAAEESVALGGADARNGRLSALWFSARSWPYKVSSTPRPACSRRTWRPAARRHDVADVAFTLREIANVALERDLPEEAAAPLDEASELVAVHAESLWLQGLLVADRARMHLAMGRVADARAGYERSMARAQVFGIAQGIAGCSLALARVERIEGGDLAEARRCCRKRSASTAREATWAGSPMCSSRARCCTAGQAITRWRYSCSLVRRVLAPASASRRPGARNGASAMRARRRVSRSAPRRWNGSPNALRRDHPPDLAALV